MDQNKAVSVSAAGIGGRERVADRFLYTRETGEWIRTRLYP